MRDYRPPRTQARRRRVVALSVSCIAAFTVCPCNAQDRGEFTAFRLTDVSGSVSLAYMKDRAATAAGPGSDGSVLLHSRSVAMVSLNTRSYVYHPSLLSLEAGVGAQFQHASYVAESDGSRGTTATGKPLYDLTLRATILRDKPYTGSLFYERLNPSVTVGPAIVILQENTRKGVQLALLAPATPIPLTLDITRQRTIGSGSGRVLDDLTDRYTLTADTAIQRIGTSRLRIDGSKLDSQSGSVDLPIVRTTNSSTSAGLDTRLQFGQEDRYRLTNLITYANLRYTLGHLVPADRTDRRVYLDLSSRHSAEMQSRISVDGSNSEQGMVNSRTRQASAGATWWPARDLISTLELRSNRISTTAYESTDRGIAASADYQFALAGGRAQAGYAARHSARSQQAVVPTTPVVGERHLLSGVNFATLDRQHVVPGSIRISNEPRTQTYLEGRDYVVVVVGNLTRVQRIVTGDITDGQTILVDYDAETGGTFDSTQLDQTLNLSWAMSNRFNVYARWFESSPRLRAGAPRFALNSVKSGTLGVRADWPIAVLWSVGGNVEYENRRESVLPSRRGSADLFVQWEEAWLGPGSVRLAARRQRVDYDGLAQDVDLAGYELHYRVAMPSGLELLADLSTESDVGGLVVRRRDFGSIRARWRFRQLMSTLSITRVDEAQGVLRTRRAVGQWLLQRDF